MCLCTVHKKPQVTNGKGWKDVSLIDGRYRGLYFDIPFNEHKWNIDQKRAILSGIYGKYETGYHIYYKRKPSLLSHYRLLPVEFRKVVATGGQDGLSVVVAKEFRFIKEEG